jgi:hypothetical protein
MQVRGMILAVAAFGFVSLSHLATASAEQTALEMYIENQGDVTLYYSSSNSISVYPDTISPGTRSSEIKTHGEGSTHTLNGNIIYSDNQDSTGATCSVQIKFNYSWNASTHHCDDKQFYLNTLVGTCALAKNETCFGAQSCGCNFVFTDN